MAYNTNQPNIGHRQMDRWIDKTDLSKNGYKLHIIQADNNMSTALSDYLLMYHVTPHYTTGKSPSELMKKLHLPFEEYRDNALSKKKKTTQIVREEPNIHSFALVIK